VRQGDASLGVFRVAVPGRHNVLNALAAVAVGAELGLPPDTIRAALAEFQGVDRRFQLRGERRGVRVVDDYGHHPTEIRVTLEAARATGAARVIAVFQPHRYSRAAALREEFAGAFAGADTVFATAIYPASEAPLPGVSGRALADAMRAAGHPDVRYEEDFTRLAAAVADSAAPGDLVVVFGAGNIYQVSPLILDALGKDNRHE
jgi:UDP-N-acetylmuramate--alanine ligase